MEGATKKKTIGSYQFQILQFDWVRLYVLFFSLPLSLSLSAKTMKKHRFNHENRFLCLFYSLDSLFVYVSAGLCSSYTSALRMMIALRWEQTLIAFGLNIYNFWSWKHRLASASHYIFVTFHRHQHKRTECADYLEFQSETYIQ